MGRRPAEARKSRPHLCMPSLLPGIKGLLVIPVRQNFSLRFDAAADGESLARHLGLARFNMEPHELVVQGMLAETSAAPRWPAATRWRCGTRAGCTTPPPGLIPAQHRRPC